MNDGRGKMDIKKATIHFIYSFMPIKDKDIILTEDELRNLYNQHGKPKSRMGYEQRFISSI